MNMIIPLAEKAGLLAGETVNVILFDEGGYKSFQTLTKVEVIKEYGHEWLLLRWHGGKLTPWGAESCGFGGYKIDETLINRLKSLAT